jgi:hypothetical protein
MKSGSGKLVNRTVAAELIFCLKIYVQLYACSGFFSGI